MRIVSSPTWDDNHHFQSIDLLITKQILPCIWTSRGSLKTAFQQMWALASVQTELSDVMRRPVYSISCSSTSQTFDKYCCDKFNCPGHVSKCILVHIQRSQLFVCKHKFTQAVRASLLTYLKLFNPCWEYSEVCEYVQGIPLHAHQSIPWGMNREKDF